MNAHLNEQNKGILQLHHAKRGFLISRHTPSMLLRPFIQHYWVVSWNLVGQASHQQDVLQHPGVNIILQSGHSRINGIESGKSSYTLEGEGEIIGVLFRPGAFHCYGGKSMSMSMLVNHTADISDFFPFDAKTAEASIFSHTNIESKLECIEQLLMSNLPKPDQTVDLLDSIVKVIIENREITRVEQLEPIFHMTQRSLQRIFKQYIGITPKWVIQRYRMHDACAKIESGTDLTRLALELGYYDQAHFSKDFKTMIGKTPKEYAKTVTVK